GRWVVAEACRRAAAWRGSSTGMPVAVNVSGAQLAQPGLVEEVGAVLRETGLPPESLTLEITESVVMQDTEATLERLQTLKRAGVRLAVDDFGTGYSSLRYLRRFPIDTLKIDKVFVEDLGKSGEEPALAQAILELGRNFGMQVVAEGVETADQVERLLALGCAYGQGFHFAGPTDPERLPALLTGLPRQSLGA
ncbi:MAG TPA: EAL domain-containing protein, partial [Thermoleophilaceae bacterium]|nr:EAL domain-containing protein [Thermoleophilaceae bacterium]